jgi:hypothetical protein
LATEGTDQQQGVFAVNEILGIDSTASATAGAAGVARYVMLHSILKPFWKTKSSAMFFKSWTFPFSKLSHNITS